MRLVLSAAALACSLAAGPAMAGGSHEFNYAFTLSPGGAKSFPMPVGSWPVTLTASLSARNGGTQTPSAVIGAVINEDATSHQLTWIGTNGDGSQVAGTTLGTPTVASFAFDNAVLTAAHGSATSPGTLTITQSSTTTAVRITYWVTMTY